VPGSGRTPARVAVLAHGCGSTGDFVARALGGPLREAGWSIETVEDRTGRIDAVAEAVADAVRTSGAELVAGVSLGAHAVARWAAHDPAVSARLEGLLLLLPAWTGPPGPVAALSLDAAGRVERLGVPAALRTMDDGSWVSEELGRAWPAYGKDLVPALRATALSPGPTLEELSRIRVPVGVVSLVGDPFHPVEVAREWATALPHAAVIEISPHAPAMDREVLGRAALLAWNTARLST
jgi:pimeloyl-ACP methyl ester carboxylesterase